MNKGKAKHSRTISLKTYVATILLCVAIAVASVAYVRSQGVGSTFTLSSGIYPGAPSYTVWADGSGNYFAKDANGAIDYSGTNVATVMLHCIESLTSGGLIYCKDLQWDTSVTVPSNVLVEQFYGGVLTYIGSTQQTIPTNAPLNDANYIIGQYNSTFYYAKNGTTGNYDALASDASSVIQYAINQTATGFGNSLNGKIYVYAGNFNIGTTITCPQAAKLLIAGSGSQASWFNGTANPMFSIKELHDATAGGIIFEDLGFKGVANSMGVYVQASPIYTSFYRCHFEGFTGSGVAIELNSTFDHTIDHCEIQNNYVAIWLQGNTTQAIALTHIQYCDINSGNTYALLVYGLYNDFDVEGCNIETFSYGVWIQGLSSVNSGSLLNGSKAEFNHNYIEGNSMGSSNFLIHIASSLACPSAIAFNFNHLDAAAIGNIISITNVTQISFENNVFLDVPVGKVIFSFNANYLPIWCDHTNTLWNILGSGMYYSENAGLATISSNTSVTVNHDLAGTPLIVLATPNSDIILSYNYTYSVTSITLTQFTITVSISGTYYFDWYARLNP